MHHYPYRFEPDSSACGSERALRVLALAMLALLLILLVEAAPAARAAETDEPGGPMLRMAGDAAPGVGAVALETHLQIEVAGLLARATLTQRFRNDSADWREAEYLLPLPPDAAVTRLDLQVGERRIEGEIRERAEARQVYDAARRAGKRSALLEQQRPQLFTTRVANVPPGEEVRVHIELVLPVAFRDGEFSLRFPTTVTAPYVPGTPLRDAAAESPRGPAPDTWLPLSGSGWAAPTDQVPDAPLIAAFQHVPDGNDARPLNPLHLEVALNPGIPLANIDALYHELRVDRAGEGFAIALRDGVAEMDRDLVLRWRPRPRETPQAAVFRERFDGEDFALLMLLPPTAQGAAPTLPRELILVIDVSGSMQGESIRQARRSVLHALGTLSSDDFVNVIAFNNGHVALFERARRADAQTLERARAFVNGLDASGGTEMQPALLAALRAPQPLGAEDSKAPLRQLIFVTDGAVANEAALLALLEAERGDSRVFTVGIGSAPNGYFMHQAARAGRGDAVFIARPDEVQPQLNALFARIEAPQARDLEVQWPAPVEAFPAAVPDLYAGQPLLQVVRLDAAPAPGSIWVRGELAGRAWERQVPLPATGADPGVARHWARSKLGALLRDMQRGEPRETVRAVGLPLALRFSLASPFTSFVAVEKEPLRPARAPLLPGQVPNTRPQGQAPQTFAFAQGATTGRARLYLGGLLAFIALIAFTLTRPEPDECDTAG